MIEGFMKSGTFLYGAVIKLTREDSLADIERHFQKMKQAGFDTAVVWPSAFWWEEKKEGYPFNTGKAVLAIAERIGLKIIMELAGQLPMMEYIPDFQMKDAYYCVDENGHKRLSHGSFGWLNYFHPEVDALIKAHFKKTAEAYKGFTSLIAYDVFNETAFNSFDEYTMQEFRLWLKQKYQTVEHLNDVWEHSYTDFSQIGFAPWMWMSIMPAADLGRFRRESVATVVKGWCDAIRKVDASRPMIADNIGSMVTNGVGVYDRPQDDISLKGAVDEIGMSFYPKQVAGTYPADKRWQTFDSFYAASGREGFYVSEMQTHIQALFNPTTAVRPYELKHWCYEAIASGAKGLIYWMWRPFTKGLQTSGRGLIDYRERSTPRLELARELSGVIAELGPLTPQKSKVGILFDVLCEDFQLLYTRSYRKVDQNVYLSSICGAYGAMLHAGIRCDIVSIEEISDYRVILLTNHIVMSEHTASVLSEYVKSGGVVVCDGKIGFVDELSMLSGELPGGAFNEMMGIDLIDSDYENMRFALDGRMLEGHYGREIVELKGAQSVASFEDGMPAIVKNCHGKGEVITVNTYLWHSYETKTGLSEEFASYLDQEYRLRNIEAPSPLMVRVSENAEFRYAFVFNYTDRDVSGRVLGDGFDTDVTVKAHGVEILKVSKR